MASSSSCDGYVVSKRGAILRQPVPLEPRRAVSRRPSGQSQRLLAPVPRFDEELQPHKPIDASLSSLARREILLLRSNCKDFVVPFLVGGCSRSVLLSTLRKESYGNNDLFRMAIQFHEDPSRVPTKDGCIFLDRDLSGFDLLLNALRGYSATSLFPVASPPHPSRKRPRSEAPPVAGDNDLVAVLLEEAAFFHCQEIVTQFAPRRRREGRCFLLSGPSATSFSLRNPTVLALASPFECSGVHTEDFIFERGDHCALGFITESEASAVDDDHDFSVRKGAFYSSQGRLNWNLSERKTEEMPAFEAGDQVTLTMDFLKHRLNWSRNGEVIRIMSYRDSRALAFAVALRKGGSVRFARE